MVEKSNNNSIGQVFTPDFIAEFMVKNALHFITNHDLKVLEPSVGEGVFLKHLIKNRIKDITAYEIDNKLGKIISNKYPGVNFKFENFLAINGSKKFDLIIGNPPYLGQNYNAKIFQEYVSQYPICAKYFVGNMDIFYFFIHQAINKLKPGGILSFITTNYWITKSRKTGIKLLKPHILEECFLIQYIDLSNLKLFKHAKGQHNCIFVMQKKTDEEKRVKTNKNIDVVKIINKNGYNAFDEDLNKQIFRDLFDKKKSEYLISYISALTNNDLSTSGNWNLLYPEKVKNIVTDIENFCLKKSKIQYLKDYFFIRNGIIFIQDEIFILVKDKNLLIKDKEFFIKIDNKFIKLSEREKSRLKKIYKSKSIKPFGLNYNDYRGYAIYFNKNEFNHSRPEINNEKYEMEYPALTTYLKQFKNDLKSILINAKENPLDLFFPRRGAFFRDLSNNLGEKLIDVEPLYEGAKKVFFKYISNENIFGFSNDPYYATSDTYFLWPRVPAKNIDYPFILAYLNSKVVNFLFKAKNIVIKRSKTKLEYGLPIPNLRLFNTKEESSIILLISSLSEYLIFMDDDAISANFIRKSLNIPYFSTSKNEKLKKDLTTAFLNKNRRYIMKIIDFLFFQLFKLDEGVIDNLTKKYY